MSAPKIVFFQEILIGDLKKQRALSNQAATGGGARDLRIPAAYLPFLKNFFTKKVGAILSTEVHWRDENNKKCANDLELWSPTKARPSELRIAKINSVDAWKINSNEEAQFKADLANHLKWFYILVKTADDKVSANILKASQLEEAENTIKKIIKDRIRENKRGSVRGVYFYKDGKVYP